MSAVVQNTDVCLRVILVHVSRWQRPIGLAFAPLMAAERLKNVAPGASPGLVLALNSAPEGRKTQIFRPFRGSASPRQGDPGLTPGATLLSRSAAGTASSAITSNH